MTEKITLSGKFDPIPWEDIVMFYKNDEWETTAPIFVICKAQYFIFIYAEDVGFTEIEAYNHIKDVVYELKREANFHGMVCTKCESKNKVWNDDCDPPICFCSDCGSEKLKYVDNRKEGEE